MGWQAIDDWLADRGETERTRPIQPYEHTAAAPQSYPEAGRAERERPGRQAPTVTDRGRGRPPTGTRTSWGRNGRVLQGVSHGTWAAYRKGCSCPECRAWNARYQREYQRLRREREDRRSA